ncbi:MAG: LysR family transcriptional regulator [Kineosporiaceae bacterium]
MPYARVPDLDSLALLLEVASTGSIGGAARARGISQPSATARIRTMEALAGFPLLDRGARGSTLTGSGVLVAEWARDVLQAAATLEAGMASLRSDREHRLRVAASLTVAEYLLPGWLVRLAAERPATSVSLTAMNSAEVAAHVLAGDYDLGFVESPTLPSGLAGRVVARDRLVVVVPPGHPWTRRRRPIPASELAGTRMVHREPTSGTRQWLESALSAHGPLAAPLLEFSTTSGVRSAVAEGAGPAVFSDLALGDDLASGRLVRVPVEGVALDRTLRAVWGRGQRPTGPVADLLLLAGRES